MQAIALTAAILLAALPAQNAAGDKKEAGNMKIHAKTAVRIGDKAVAIKSAEQLGKVRNAAPEKATADVAKLLKVESIDWKKQMLIVIQGGTQRTGGYSVEAKSLEIKDGKLLVHWKLNSPAPGSIVIQVLTNPSQTVLVDRFDGDVVFDPPSPPAAGKKPGGDSKP